jgi:hypothetical protein
MKAIYFLLAFFYAGALYAQQPPPAFYEAVSRCDSFYMAKQCKAGALAYNQLFITYPTFVQWTERYNAASNWALAGDVDSAFIQLYKAAENPDFTAYNQLATDPDLDNLHTDSRWEILTKDIRQRRDNKFPNANIQLVHLLDTVFQTDQGLRYRITKTEEKYGDTSAQMQQLWNDIAVADSLNYLRIAQLLDKHGWLGADSIGRDGNTVLFLVIQHSDLAAQLKYLPLMREAVQQHRAEARNMAMLEDRVAMRQGKKQIYGSQIIRDPNSGKYYLYPVEKPEKLDERRKSVGLNSISEYVKNWGLQWSLQQYKADLPMVKKLVKK